MHILRRDGGSVDNILIYTVSRCISEYVLMTKRITLTPPLRRYPQPALNFVISQSLCKKLVMTMESTIHTQASKRRKLRKGTHSCRECKRRKARCVFASPVEGVCIGCRHRGTLCMGQDEEPEWDNREGIGETKIPNQRLERIEFMLEALMEERGLNSKGGHGRTGNKDAVTSENVSPPTMALDEAGTANNSVESSHHPGPNITLSQQLYELHPSAEECRTVCANSDYIPCFFQQLLSRNYLQVFKSPPQLVLTRTELAIPPPPSAHPILLAQRLLILACISQYSGDDSESTMRCRARIQDLANIVIEMIMTKDHLMGNAEGLECLMLEATFHWNNGNIRRAFTTIRRAMALAQLLGLHRHEYQAGPQQIDNQAPKFDAAYMWYRIVYLDRLYCLILGVPQGSSDIKFANPTAVLNMSFEEHLEREHCIIASQILSRNELETHENTTTFTSAIEKALQSAANIPPTSWWLLPTLTSTSSRADRFLATSRLALQLFHFNLINQTHLPYIFQHTSSCKSASSTTPYDPDPSKIACATASREILSRYLLMQDLRLVSYAYTFLDFFTLIAAMTLLTLHIDTYWRHRSSTPHILAHMRPSDRAMVERLVHFLSLKDSGTSAKGLRVLEELLGVEEEVWRWGSVGKGGIVREKGEINVEVEEGEGGQKRFFEIRMPWYGLLRLNARMTCFQRCAEVEEVETRIEDIDTSIVEEEADVLLGGWLNGGEGDLSPTFLGPDLEGFETGLFDSLDGAVGGGDE
ncbi:unnamed protein product [Periconia digitata]|uniref:Zn(2)-C6 fungal-type domain-containing protein n=1 Tax=Periconia digitata TaxID=1303443 RepID=A0A9W4U277_9PLEO|nr:unnamed protein product [Periconia digitata]